MLPIQALIDPTVARKTRFLSRLTASIHSRLPQNLAQRCWVSGLGARSITITADSAETCSQIRHHQHEICKQVNEEFGKYLDQSVMKLRLKVDCRMREVLSQTGTETVSYDKPTKKQLAKTKCSEMLEMIHAANGSGSTGRPGIKHR